MRLLDYSLLGSAPSRRRGSPVSLTALIDVVFILLLFFMLTSSFTQWRSLDVVVDTPGAAADVTPEEPLIVRLSGDGALLISEHRVPAPFDRAQLLALAAGLDTRPVILEPAGDASTQQVVNALDALKAVGAARLSLANGAD
jgi:biopolymer transport protein ExbD